MQSLQRGKLQGKLLLDFMCVCLLKQELEATPHEDAAAAAEKTPAVDRHEVHTREAD